MEDELKKLCNMLSDIGSFGIWVVNKDNEIVFQNEKLSDMFGKKIVSITDMFSETELLLMHHNHKGDFDIRINGILHKVKFEQLDENHDVGMIRKITANEDLINQLQNLKKEFKQIITEY